jgi:hypothetical protein
MINNLPAVDDEELRKEQAKRFSDGMHNLGEFAKELKHHQRISTITGIISWIIIMLAVGSVIIYALVTEGFDGMVDKEALSRRLNCTSESFNDTVRTYADANEFVALTGGSCTKVKE